MELSETIYTEVKTVIASIAEQFGIGVDYLWPIFVRAQYWEPIASIISVFIFTIGFIYGGKLMTKALKKHREEGLSRSVDESKEAPEFFTGLILFILCGFGSVAAIITLLATGTCLISPEYCAFKEVLNMIN